MRNKPYLVIPKLIHQPTWGGRYILKMKGWDKLLEYKGVKIGQSYELCGESKLSNAQTSDEIESGEATLSVADFKEQKPFPLIKLTQARGNSFQLHVRQTDQNKKWKPKAESWLYLEDGKITCGIKKGADVKQYKTVCIEIESKMQELSSLIKKRAITQEKAKHDAQSFIQNKNPWQFVNVLLVKKGDMIDLSSGGIHHSWEEDKNLPLGNIVYEIQQDVDDASSTLRSFDQGKFMNDGTVRQITIEDYFTYIDLSENKNTPHIQKKGKTHAFKTPYYSLDILKVVGEKKCETKTSFHHLFVVKGEVQVAVGENKVTIKEGHSSFIPHKLVYTIKAFKRAELLKTFIQ